MWDAIKSTAELLLALVRIIKGAPSGPSEAEKAAAAELARHGQASGAARNTSSRLTERAEAAKKRDVR